MENVKWKVVGGVVEFECKWEWLFVLEDDNRNDVDVSVGSFKIYVVVGNCVEYFGYVCIIMLISVLCFRLKF